MRLRFPPGSALALAAALSACGPAAGPPTPDEAAKAAEIQKTLPAPYNTADLVNGRTQFQLCSQCHTLIEGGANMTGPNLYGVFGRRAATTVGFKYSPVMQKLGWVWTPEHLDRWLASPQTTLPGTKMSFVGLKDAKARTDVIAYVAVVSKGGPL
jgi:cytochrome c